MILQQTMSFIDALTEKVLGSPIDRMVNRLQRQPFHDEYLLAEDFALQHTIGVTPQLEKRAEQYARSEYDRLMREGRVRSGKEKKWWEFCVRNGRRSVWEYHFDVREELGRTYAALWEQRMRELGVLDEFQELYVSGGKSAFVSTFPNEPYF